MRAPRHLIVIADDFGIGLETSRGVLDLAARGLVTGSVLLVNSPYAEQAVQYWRKSGVRLELGWHPNLTLDAPVCPPTEVPSLISPQGTLWPLGRFLARLARGQIRWGEMEREFRAQFRRFIDLVGYPPTLVNSHQHISLFPPVGRILRRVLTEANCRPWYRRVREPWMQLRRIPGARVKRSVLTILGRLEAWQLAAGGFPGRAWLAGITNPTCLRDPLFFVRWLTTISGRDIELACHPGHLDLSLLGRDATLEDHLLERRVLEYRLLSEPSFLRACRQAGFTFLAPSECTAGLPRGVRHAA
jgi:predicted glycoside hydrolase/deacetylase ChbG (UPF0249 family)